MDLDKQKALNEFNRSHFFEYSLGTGTEMIGDAEDLGLSELGDQRNYGKGPRNWKGVDEHIVDEACEALFKSYRVDASDIEVLVKNKEIILNGYVTSLDEKDEAERSVEHIQGVAKVFNNLVVHPRLNQPLVGGDKDVGMI